MHCELLTSDKKMSNNSPTKATNTVNLLAEIERQTATYKLNQIVILRLFCSAIEFFLKLKEIFK